jgi:hypothetical protein
MPACGTSKRATFRPISTSLSAGKLQGILDRYDHRRLPFYQYLAAALNFEFSHFLRRRKLPRSHSELLSVEELAGRRVELHQSDSACRRRRGSPVSQHAADCRASTPSSRSPTLCPIADLKLLVSQRRTKDPAERWGCPEGLPHLFAFCRIKEAKISGRTRTSS